MEKELYEREERAEMQQEILKKVARTLPVYTRTPDGGEATTQLVSLRLEEGHTSCEPGNGTAEMISLLLSKGYFISSK